MSSSPPPPYSLRPPPYMRRTLNQKKSQPTQGQQQQQQQQPQPQQRKSSPTSRSPRRPSSRELLTDALRRAQRAVELDSAESDVPAAIAAYDDAIALLQRVIERRSRKPGCTSEVERVTDIHDRYVERVRELCHTHRMPLPSHVFPVPRITTATPTCPITIPTSTDSPRKTKPTRTRKMNTTMTSHPPNSIQQKQHQQQPLPDSPPPPTRAAFIQRLKLKHRQSHRAYSDDYSEYNDDDDHYGDDETEHDPGLSPCSSKSTTPETQSPISPVDDNDDDNSRDEPHGWILSAARDEELKEWGQYLDETGANRRLSGGTGASSTGWSAIALSCGECLPIR